MTTIERFDIIAGRYEPISVIGTGGMGVVYRASDLELDREIVALKLIHKTLSSNESNIIRFRQEVKVARRLSHPNIVKIFDLGTTQDKHLFLTMEFVDGEDLRTKMNQAGPSGLPLTDVINILFEVSLALDYAHAHEVVHRDVKPENILVEKSGQVKLTDFGAARQMLVDSRVTPAGHVIGSPHYMPPEVFKGDKIDGRVDIYSLGALCFELLTGSPPFQSAQIASVITQHINHPVPKVNTLRKGLPEWVQDFIECCMEKKPSDRYSSMSEVAILLARRLLEMNIVPNLHCLPKGLYQALLNKRKGLLSRLFSP